MCLLASIAPASNSGSYTLTVTAGINELNDDQKVNIFPNPVHGIISIESDKKISTVEIMNLVGEKIYSGNINGELSAKIDLSSQPKGMYFIRIKSDGASAVKKIFIE